MRFVFLRSTMACLTAAAVLASVMTCVASAKKSEPPKTDVLEQCSGAQKIEGEGSTFAAPAEFLWTGTNSEKGNERTGTGFNVSSSSLACSGSQGSKQMPEVYYNQSGSLTRGSGSCLKGWGNGIRSFGEVKSGESYPHVNRYPFCGTDEAPSQAVKEEFEAFMEPGGETGKGEAIESIPVAQGAVAIIVHLPKDCLASSEITTAKGKKESLGRLALDQEVIEMIYRGKIKTWEEAISAQGGDGNDRLTCTEDGEKDAIRPVVRADRSGTTQIFKEFLAQVYNGEWEAEAFSAVNGERPCTGADGEDLEEGALESWERVAEGCENQRWPLAAHVLRPSETGNPGVVNEVDDTESSIGYADVAVAQESGFFSNKGEGGENKKREQHHEFWAVVQNSKPGATPVTFSDPSSKGDTEKQGNSECKDTHYVLPESTREDWSKVKGENVTKTYPICGLTYVLAARQYWYFLERYGLTEEESRQIATTVHDFLQWVVSTNSGGGGAVLKDHDYEALPKEVQAEAVLGAREIGNKICDVCLSVTPSPLVFTKGSPNEQTITLAAVGAAEEELEIVKVSAIAFPNGHAGWVKLNGATCEGAKLAPPAACAEDFKITAFPPNNGETWEAEYEIKWKSVKPALARLKSVIVKLKAQA